MDRFSSIYWWGNLGKLLRKQCQTSNKKSTCFASCFVSFRCLFAARWNIWRIIKTINYFWLRKYARIVVLGHYLFLEAHSCPRASLSGNCSLLGTNNILGQLSVHISSPKVVYSLSLAAGGISSDIYVYLCSLVGLVQIFMYISGRRWD